MPTAQTIVAALLLQRTPISFKAFGPSMHPTIRDGETVVVQPLPSSAIRCGTVILYQIHGRLTLHRYVFNAKRTNGVFAVGDASVKGGDWVPTADILGVAACVRRDGRVRRLDTRRARWTGLIRYALRPLRRMAVAVHRRLFHSP